MSETKLDWSDLQLFLAVAREGGLAAAATVTGKSAPTLGRRMLALERHIGQDLFHRLARGYTLTPDGQALLDSVQAMEQALTAVEGTGERATSARVKISAGFWMTRLLCSYVDRLKGADPLILQFIASNHLLDIEHREVVIGIRNARPEEPHLACRRSANIQFATFAACENADGWIQVLADTPSARWVRENINEKTAIELSNPGNVLDCLLNSRYKAVLPLFVGRNTSGLLQLSEPIDQLEHQQWLVMHHDDRHLPEVRLVIDRLYDLLQDKLT